MKQETILALLQYAGYTPGRNDYANSDQLIQRVSRVRTILHLVAINYVKMAEVRGYLEANAHLLQQLLCGAVENVARANIPGMFPIFATICGDRDSDALFAEVNWELMSYRRSIQPGSFGKHLDYPALIADIEKIQFVDGSDALIMMRTLWELHDRSNCRELYGATLIVNPGSREERSIHIKTIEAIDQVMATFPGTAPPCKIQIHLVPETGLPMRKASKIRCKSLAIFNSQTGNFVENANDLTVGKVYEVEGAWDPWESNYIHVLNNSRRWREHPIYLFKGIAEWTFPTRVECVSNVHVAVDTQKWPAEGSILESHYALTPGKQYKVLDVRGWEVWDNTEGPRIEWFYAPNLRFVVMDNAGKRAAVHFSCFKDVEWGLKKSRIR